MDHLDIVGEDRLLPLSLTRLAELQAKDEECRRKGLAIPSIGNYGSPDSLLQIFKYIFPPFSTTHGCIFLILCPKLINYLIKIWEMLRTNGQQCFKLQSPSWPISWSEVCWSVLQRPEAHPSGPVLPADNLPPPFLLLAASPGVVRWHLAGWLTAGWAAAAALGSGGAAARAAL